MAGNGRMKMIAKKLTAEELAVKMEMGNHDWADDAADMLRQQQDEIETLKAEIIMQNERWKKIHPKERELEMKYSDEWWKGVALLNKSFPFKLGRK